VDVAIFAFDDAARLQLVNRPASALAESAERLSGRTALALARRQPDGEHART